MVNQEIFGGLVSALSRGESLHKAMFSLFNAGYEKKDIEEAALMLQSQTTVQISQKQVIAKKQMESGKIKPNVPDKTKVVPQREEVPKEEKKYKQTVSQYGVENNPAEFNKIIKETIKDLGSMKAPIKIVKSDSEFKPPIIIQKISDYNFKSGKKVSRAVIFVLFILLGLLLGTLAILFIFKDKIIDIFNNLGF